MARTKRQAPEQVEESEPVYIETAKMTDAEYLAFVTARASDVSLMAEERLFAMREIGRLRANGVF